MLLALDTSTRHISLALHDGLSLLAEHSWRAGDHHSVELAPNTALMLRRAGVEPGRLQGIAVALGPGSYTGLRIGLGLAKGLALAHHLPLFGVPTFDGLMRGQPQRAGLVLALLHAGRARVSVAAYRWHAAARGGAWAPEGETRVLGWEALAGGIGEPAYMVGEIDERGHEALRTARHVVIAPPAEALRRAGYLAEIGWERLRAGRADDARALAPIYGGQPEGMAP